MSDTQTSCCGVQLRNHHVKSEHTNTWKWVLYLPATRRLWIKRTCQLVCCSFMVSLHFTVDLIQSLSWESSCHVGINSCTNTVFSHTVSLFLCCKYSNYHRSTEIKVYSSDINADVYVIGQNRANQLLKYTWRWKWRIYRYYCFTTRWRQVTVKKFIWIFNRLAVSHFEGCVLRRSHSKVAYVIEAVSFQKSK